MTLFTSIAQCSRVLHMITWIATLRARCPAPGQDRNFADRSFVLIFTRDNGSEPENVCKRCDGSYLRGGRVASAFYRRGYTLCDRLSALPYWLSDGCIVSAATEKGGQLEVLGAAGLAGGGTREI